MTERYNKPLTGSKMSFQGFTCEKERIFSSCLIISQTLQVFLISFISHIYLFFPPLDKSTSPMTQLLKSQTEQSPVS